MSSACFLVKFTVTMLIVDISYCRPHADLAVASGSAAMLAKVMKWVREQDWTELDRTGWTTTPRCLRNVPYPYRT